jgi:hypothetical protein
MIGFHVVEESDPEGIFCFYPEVHCQTDLERSKRHSRWQKIIDFDISPEMLLKSRLFASTSSFAHVKSHETN